MVRAVAEDNIGYTFEPLLRGATGDELLSRMPRSLQNSHRPLIATYCLCFRSLINLCSKSVSPINLLADTAS